MANPYFQFKKFTVYQDRCAMKVCTDACLFGAVVARNMQAASGKTATGIDASTPNMLDIGCGTGLLSLMLAQKTNAVIDAIEISKDAFLQARDNILSSPWKNRIQVIHADVKAYAFTKQYDLIVSNPPFYEHHLRSPEEEKNLARHDESLTYKDLIHIIYRILSPDGWFAVLIPYHQSDGVIQLAKNAGLFLHHHISVKSTPKHHYFRSICQFSIKQPCQVTEEELIVKKEDSYTEEFSVLLNDYYLNL